MSVREGGEAVGGSGRWKRFGTAAVGKATGNLAAPNTREAGAGGWEGVAGAALLWELCSAQRSLHPLSAVWRQNRKQAVLWPRVRDWAR